MNRKRAALLLAPVMLLAGALWFVAERRPVEARVSGGVPEMLQRLAQECKRKPHAVSVEVARRVQKAGIEHEEGFSFKRREATLMYYRLRFRQANNARAGRGWAFEKVRDADVFALQELKTSQSVVRALEKRGRRMDSTFSYSTS